MEKIDLPKNISDFRNRKRNAFYFQSEEKFIEGIIAEYYVFKNNDDPYHLVKMLGNFEKNNDITKSNIVLFSNYFRFVGLFSKKVRSYNIYKAFKSNLLSNLSFIYSRLKSHDTLFNTNIYYQTFDFSEILIRQEFFTEKIYHFFETTELEYTTEDVDSLLDLLTTPGDVQAYYAQQKSKTSFSARQSVLAHGIWGRASFVVPLKINVTLHSKMLNLGADSCKDALVAFDKFSEGKISQSEWTFWQKDLICIYKSISSKSEQNEIKTFVDKLHSKNPIIQWSDIEEKLK